jgi:hypothetical protein
VIVLTPKSWLRWLPWAEYCYNTSFQSALKTTPFQVVYGRPPPSLISYTADRAKVQAVDRQLVDRDVFLQEIRERLRHAQDLMKQQYDAGHRDVFFEVGEWVWLRLHQRQAAAITEKTAGKLAPKFYGPFQVKECIGDLSYRMELPPKSQIHNVFHVLFLKKFVGTPPGEIPPLPPIKRGRVLPVPLKIVQTRLNRGNWELLVQWLGRSTADASWEPLEEFSVDYPDFQLEDELFHREGGSVIDAFVGRTYQRRPKAAQAGDMDSNTV